MKNAKQLLCTVICAVFLPLPWTIFPLRTNQWALKVRNPVMKICLAVNLAYAVFGAVALMMINV